MSVPRTSAEALVHRFLTLMEARDIDGMRPLIRVGAPIVFPGGIAFDSLDALFEGSRKRYRHVGKDFERFDSFVDAAGVTIVYCFGTLRGIFADGAPVPPARFIDRFEISDGIITRQDVWNDIAVLRPAMAGPAPASG
jgi:hypothetical protein